MPILPNLLFIVLIAINTIFLTFLTAKGGLTDNRYSHPLKRLTKRGKNVLLVLLIMGILLFAQELNTNNSNNKKELELQQQRDQKDNAITKGIKNGVDSASKKLFDDISVAFAKQEFRLDTLNQQVEKIRDSTKGIINNYGQADPVLAISFDGVKVKLPTGQRKNYSVDFTSVDAGSTNFDIKCYIVSKFIDNSIDVSRGKFFPKKMSLSKNGKWNVGFGSESQKQTSDIYFYVTGTYTTLDGVKKYSVDDVYDFDISEKQTDLLIGKERDEIINLIMTVPEHAFK